MQANPLWVPPGWVLFLAYPHESDHRWWHQKERQAYFDGPSQNNDTSMLDWDDLVTGHFTMHYPYPSYVALPVGA